MTAPTEPLTPAIQALVDAELENYSDGISYGKHSDARRSLTDFAVAVRDVARDDAAELRAAVREYRHARDWYRYAWGTPDENGAHGRLAAADEALHRLAATEGQP